MLTNILHVQHIKYISVNVILYFSLLLYFKYAVFSLSHSHSLSRDGRWCMSSYLSNFYSINARPALHLSHNSNDGLLTTYSDTQWCATLIHPIPRILYISIYWHIFLLPAPIHSRSRSGTFHIPVRLNLPIHFLFLSLLLSPIIQSIIQST